MQSPVQEAGRHQVHHLGEPLLPPRPGVERGRRRGRPQHADQGEQGGVDRHVQELGAALADQRRLNGAVVVVPGHRQRRPPLHLLAHHPPQLADRANLRRQELQVLSNAAEAPPKPYFALRIISLSLRDLRLP
ncbi:hypothetical protein MUK42_05441 [Musa troglodytarum]|uniref:Uncharacterized protein n=1 Tax=Musa troglodytarum TaxID=320322 RepID=A0A9E7EN09_9LILI|nr:hypothetical protein MUK42_05441 [Musa troglodytarum]